MRKLSVFLFLLLMPSMALSLSVAEPEPVGIQLSQGPEKLNLTISNNVEVDASNITVNASFNGVKERKFFTHEDLDAGETHTFVVTGRELENSSVQNISMVYWNMSAAWNENLPASFDILDESQEENRTFSSYAVEEKESPIEFEFLRDNLVVYEDEFSKTLGLEYQPSTQSEVNNLNVSLEGPDYLNISSQQTETEREIKLFSLDAPRSSIDRDHLNLTVKAEYDTTLRGEESVEDSGSEASLFDVLGEFFSLFVWTFSFSVELVISALGLVF